MEVPCVDMFATGLNIVELMHKNNVRPVDIQNMLGFNTAQAIYKWERGRSLPSVEHLFFLAKIFGCSIEDIIVLTNN